MPLVSETETSDYPAVSEHSVEKQTTLSTGMPGDMKLLSEPGATGKFPTQVIASPLE